MNDIKKIPAEAQAKPVTGKAKHRYEAPVVRPEGRMPLLTAGSFDLILPPG